MHITQIVLENFRGSEKLTIELSKRMNVFIGNNGAGKSTVLDATAILLSWLANRIKFITSSGRPISDNDIKNGFNYSNITINVDNNGHSFTWNLVKTRRGYNKKDNVSSLTMVTELAKHFQMLIHANNSSTNIPLLAYYPVNRSVLDIPLRIKGKHRFDLLSAYDESLTAGANFRTFFEWFREREDLENENRKYENEIIKPEGYEFPDKQLSTVRNALSEFMPGFNDLTVRRNPLRMEINKNGQILKVSQLSDGEKCLMAIVGDIARRLAIANPQLSNPLEGEGIILIDEIDLHLHPKWQRIVVQKLNEVFCNCQFLISSHSPHIITHVKKESMFLISNIMGQTELIRPQESYGKNVERILEDLMGLNTTRPDSINQAILNIYDEIDRGNYTESLNLIAQLEFQIGSDPELVRARALIKRKELIGK